MSERRDEITSENARPLAQRIAQTLDLAFADHDVQVTIDGHDVLLEIPCPSAAVDHGLWIRWEGPEHDVIVGFHTQHAHFGPWEEYSDQEARIDAILAALDEGIATARAFLAERMVVITWYSRARSRLRLATCPSMRRPMSARVRRRSSTSGPGSKCCSTATGRVSGA